MKSIIWIAVCALLLAYATEVKAQTVVSGFTPVSAQASDDDGDPETVKSGVANMSFYWEGEWIGDAPPPAPQLEWQGSITWNTLMVPNGVGELTAQACDAAGNCAFSTPVMLDVQNNDNTAPTVEILQPQ